MEEIKLKRADILFEILVSEMIFFNDRGVNIINFINKKYFNHCVRMNLFSAYKYHLHGTISFFQEDQISAFNKQQNRHENLEGFTCILFLFKHVH